MLVQYYSHNAAASHACMPYIHAYAARFAVGRSSSEPTACASILGKEEIFAMVLYLHDQQNVATAGSRSMIEVSALNMDGL